MRPKQALKLTVQQRLGFEITLARVRIERGYESIQKTIHAGAKFSDAAMVELHEAEQILTALERVSGDFYRRQVAAMKSYGEEKKRTAREDADRILARAAGAAMEGGGA